MIFSAKFLYPVLALFSVASSAFATPVAQPATADLVARQTDVLSNVQGLDSSISPLIDQLTQAAATGSDPTSLVDQLGTIFGGSTESFKHSPSGVDIDVVAVVDVSVDVVVKLLVALSKFSVLDVGLGAKVDVFLSAWIAALDRIHPGIASQIGHGVPKNKLNIFVILKPLLSIKVLALVDILGIAL